MPQERVPNLQLPILDAFNRHRGCHHQLLRLRLIRAVQKEHAHQALTAQGAEGPQQGVLGVLGLFLVLLEGSGRLWYPSVADLHAVGAHDLYLTQLQAQRANHVGCVMVKGMH